MQLVFVLGKISMLVQLRYLNTQVAKEEPETTSGKFDITLLTKRNMAIFS